MSVTDSQKRPTTTGINLRYTKCGSTTKFIVVVSYSELRGKLEKWDKLNTATLLS